VLSRRLTCLTGCFLSFYQEKSCGYLGLGEFHFYSHVIFTEYTQSFHLSFSVPW